MPDLTRLLLWTDALGPHAEAVARAGLSGRVAVEALGRAETPSAEQLAETEAMLAWGAPRRCAKRWTGAVATDPYAACPSRAP